MLAKGLQRIRRKNRVRSKIHGTKSRPRLSVFRSNLYMFVQLIDDIEGRTLLSASDYKKDKSLSKTESAEKLGADLVKKILDLKITEIVFDRGGFAYHGRVKALADSLRSGGLKF